MERGDFCLFSLFSALILAVSGLPVSAQDLDIFGSPERESRMRSVRWDYQPGQPRRSAAPTVKATNYGAYQTQTQAVQSPAPLPAQAIAPVPGTTRAIIATPEKAPEPTSAPSDPTLNLRNLTGIEIGGQFSHYNYQERKVDVQNNGYKFGAQALLTGSVKEGWFVKGDLRFAAGEVKYEGTGTAYDSDYLFELRALGGKDLLFGRFAVAPYTGIGYRNLINDSRGTTSWGASGYRRDSQYLYIPFGVQPRMRLNNGAHLALSLEYDYLLHGWQQSKLSDADEGYPDILNHQNDGYGLRGELMYLMNKWSFGPFFNYWNIDTSKTKCAIGPAWDEEHSGCWYEPNNQTLEWGVQIRYRIY